MRANLITARKAQDLTQAQLGALVGLSKQTICDIEKGRTIGRVGVWRKLANIFKSSIEHLSLDEAAVESFNQAL